MFILCWVNDQAHAFPNSIGVRYRMAPYSRTVEPENGVRRFPGYAASACQTARISYKGNAIGRWFLLCSKLIEIPGLQVLPSKPEMERLYPRICTMSFETRAWIIRIFSGATDGDFGMLRSSEQARRPIPFARRRSWGGYAPAGTRRIKVPASHGKTRLTESTAYPCIEEPRKICRAISFILQGYGAPLGIIPSSAQPSRVPRSQVQMNCTKWLTSNREVRMI